MPTSTPDNSLGSTSKIPRRGFLKAVVAVAATAVLPGICQGPDVARAQEVGEIPPFGLDTYFASAYWFNAEGIGERDDRNTQTVLRRLAPVVAGQYGEFDRDRIDGKMVGTMDVSIQWKDAGGGFRVAKNAQGYGATVDQIKRASHSDTLGNVAISYKSDEVTLQLDKENRSEVPSFAPSEELLTRLGINPFQDFNLGYMYDVGLKPETSRTNKDVNCVEQFTISQADQDGNQITRNVSVRVEGQQVVVLWDDSEGNRKSAVLDMNEAGGIVLPEDETDGSNVVRSLEHLKNESRAALHFANVRNQENKAIHYTYRQLAEAA